MQLFFAWCDSFYNVLIGIAVQLTVQYCTQCLLVMHCTVDQCINNDNTKVFIVDEMVQCTAQFCTVQGCTGCSAKVANPKFPKYKIPCKLAQHFLKCQKLRRDFVLRQIQGGNFSGTSCTGQVCTAKKFKAQTLLPLFKETYQFGEKRPKSDPFFLKETYDQ